MAVTGRRQFDGRRKHSLTCPRQESNLHPALRRRVLYPLSYEGRRSAGYPAPRFVEEALMFCDTGHGVWFHPRMEVAVQRRGESDVQ